MAKTSQSDLFIKNLPAIYQEQEDLNGFLHPFEAIMLGGRVREADEPPGLRETIQGLPELLDPFKTREEFLPWLASWVALTLRVDLPADCKRLLIAHASSLYAWRGTSRGLEALLSIVTGGGQATIKEPEIIALTVGVQAVIGSTTRLGRDLPFFFQVNLSLPGTVLTGRPLASIEKLVRDTIELGKPAHTYYNLELSFADQAQSQARSGESRSRAAGKAGKNAGTSSQQ
jgi:phage tail-like protein